MTFDPRYSMEAIDRPDQLYAGAKGLIIFGGSLVLSYVRDGNTTSFPHYVDLPGGGRELGETPFETFQRETKEEFDLDIRRSDISFGMSYPSMTDPTVPGYFLVANKPLSAQADIHFGDEGEYYQVTTLDKLLAEPLLVPFLHDKVELYLAHVTPTQLAV